MAAQAWQGVQEVHTAEVPRRELTAELRSATQELSSRWLEATKK